MAINQSTSTAPEAQSPGSSLIVAAKALESTVRALLGGINAILDSQRPALPEPQEPAANAEEPAPDLSALHDAVMSECAALLVLQDAFSDFGQITIGHEITDDDADRLAAIHDQLHACRKRLVNLSQVTDTASVKYVLAPGEYLRKRARAAPEADKAAREPTPQAESGAPELPKALREHLQKQQERSAELWSLLKRLDEDDDTPMCTGIAVRMADEINEALDQLTLRRVLEGAHTA